MLDAWRPLRAALESGARTRLSEASDSERNSRTARCKSPKVMAWRPAVLQIHCASSMTSPMPSMKRLDAQAYATTYFIIGAVPPGNRLRATAARSSCVGVAGNSMARFTRRVNWSEFQLVCRSTSRRRRSLQPGIGSISACGSAFCSCTSISWYLRSMTRQS